MKRTILILLLSCLVFTLLPAGALAAGPDAAARGLAAIQETECWDYITLPQEDSYLDEWKTLYGRKAWYAPSLFVESVPMLGSGAPIRPFLFEGTEVTVVAEENDMSCILYYAEDNRPYAGWIPSIRLLEEFPCETLSLGEKPEGDFASSHRVDLSWSHGYLPGTQQFYTVLDEPVTACVGFTLEYQIIDEKTSLKYMVLGPRTILVSDGENWVEVGSFPYPELGTVRVQVWLDEPMDIAAVATVADCHAPNLFDFRQTLRDIQVIP